MARLAKHVGGLDGIRQLAKEQGIDLSHYEATTLGNSRIPAKFQIPYLMEELMAHLSESTGTLRRVIQEYVGAVRAWLRANHFAELADYGVTDLAHVLKQARHAATEKVTARGDAPLYQRAVSPESSSSNGGVDPMFQRRRVAEGDVGTAGAEHLNDDQRAALGKIGTIARGERLPEKWKRLTERWREKLTQGLVDQFAPLKNLDKDAYMQARLSRGTDGALEAMFLHGTPKLTDGALDVTSDGKGLRGVLGDLRGEHDLFLAWMHDAIRDFERAKLATELKGEPFAAEFDQAGGTGFDPRKDPNPACPECFGEGEECVFPKDTRDLSPAAKLLYAGVKKTERGFEIKMQSQAAALENVAKHLGMFTQTVKHQSDPDNPIPMAGLVLIPAKANLGDAGDAVG